MAKSSRGRGRKRSRRPVDWVVNSDCWGAAYNLENGDQVLIPLVIPEVQASFVDPGFNIPLARHWWPEQDRGIKCYAVRGALELIPVGWAAGSFFRAHMRVVKKPMEYATLFTAVVDPAYSLNQDTFANERFLWHKYTAHQFSMGSALEVHHIQWKGFEQLEKDEGLFLAVENVTGITQRLALLPYIRTLVSAESA